MNTTLGAICLAAVSMASAGAQASALTFYPDRTSFNQAAPNLPVQNFGSANLFGQPYVLQGNPLNARTNDAVFARGSILAGIALRTLHPGAASSAMIVYGGGPVSTVSVGNNWFGDTLVLKFSPAVPAVAFDAFGNTSGGTSFAGKINVVFLAGSKHLGGKTLTEAAGGSLFFGVASTTPITTVQVNWTSDGDATTYISDIAF